MSTLILVCTSFLLALAFGQKPAPTLAAGESLVTLKQYTCDASDLKKALAGDTLPAAAKATFKLRYLGDKDFFYTKQIELKLDAKGAIPPVDLQEAVKADRTRKLDMQYSIATAGGKHLVYAEIITIPAFGAFYLSGFASKAKLQAEPVYVWPAPGTKVKAEVIFSMDLPGSTLSAARKVGDDIVISQQKKIAYEYAGIDPATKANLFSVKGEVSAELTQGRIMNMGTPWGTSWQLAEGSTLELLLTIRTKKGKAIQGRGTGVVQSISSDTGSTVKVQVSKMTLEYKP